MYELSLSLSPSPPPSLPLSLSVPCLCVRVREISLFFHFSLVFAGEQTRVLARTHPPFPSPSPPSRVLSNRMVKTGCDEQTVIWLPDHSQHLDFSPSISKVKGPGRPFMQWTPSPFFVLSFFLLLQPIYLFTSWSPANSCHVALHSCQRMFLLLLLLSFLVGSYFAGKVPPSSRYNQHYRHLRQIISKIY